MLHELIDRDLLRRMAPRNELTDQVCGRLREHELAGKGGSLADEAVWTLLFVYGFIAPGFEGGVTSLASALTGETIAVPPCHAWLEMMPFPPRKGVRGRSEKHSRIDLTLGNLERRKKAGVQYLPPAIGSGSTCMVEAKWLSDIATQTKHDCRRNQLARVIETAITFQRFNRTPCFPERVHVTLLTPKQFHTPNALDQGSRLYFYKYREYRAPDGSVNTDRIIADINSAEVPSRSGSPGWHYPADLGVALRRLKLHWITYEELLEAMPLSPFKQGLRDLLAGARRPVLQL